jgi:predicted Fe-Mo cluster-binding NifX family protein
MRVLVSANEPSLDATIAPAFEAAPYWLLIDADSGDLQALEAADRRPFYALGVSAIITGHVADETKTLAVRAGIGLYTIPAGGIRIAVDQWKRGRLRQIAVE